jgi:hypothetical protein
LDGVGHQPVAQTVPGILTGLVTPQQRQLLPQIGAMAQRADGVLPGNHLFGYRGRLQPLRQRIPARRGLNVTEQFEQRPFTEQVQVSRAQVVGHLQVQARVAFPHPLMLKALEAALIQVEQAGEIAHAAVALTGLIHRKHRRRHRQKDRPQGQEVNGEMPI